MQSYKLFIILFLTILSVHLIVSQDSSDSSDDGKTFQFCTNCNNDNCNTLSCTTVRTKTCWYIIDPCSLDYFGYYEFDVVKGVEGLVVRTYSYNQTGCMMSGHIQNIYDSPCDTCVTNPTMPYQQYYNCNSTRLY
ncbi:hypothetical protein PPL_09810 [Heterostelium album PN500]|uniref:Uncharacterized protein n=1 Tax=Heterostelium pallidum (strain ATCC 26659 / Pp 5 / PN500) TaxID=670386 RepID=D3BP47_HETP5|nr:hypothetical protein PPL_09810 [Heterostelium album PN500]EFA77057.1 hypothetical protein PPL_09810 [Heterostelium album PN500]|eukprot:XP_020429186.1 hypothetical protein PPL_09810 [Heterostelium album PN500]